MDFEFEKKWKETLSQASAQFGETLDLNSLLFLIGLQELNLGYIKLNKEQKLDVMHVAICRLLESFGYYKFEGTDADGWPHYSLVEKLPAISKAQQERLIKEAIIEYFSEN